MFMYILCTTYVVDNFHGKKTLWKNSEKSLDNRVKLQKQRIVQRYFGGFYK